MMKQKSNKNPLLQGLFFQLVIVNILIKLIQPCNQLVDTILTGKTLGSQALQVYALFLPVNSFLLAVSSVLSNGVQITVSHLIGKGDFKKSDTTVSTSFIIGIAGSLVLSSVCFAFSGQLASILGAGVLSNSVSGYIRAYSVGIVPAILLDTIMCLMQMEGRKKLVVSGSLCVFTVNAAGDIANIYIFRKGIVGMALATSIANIMACLFLGFFFITKSKIFKIGFQNIKLSCFREVLKNGLPSLAYYGSLVIRSSFMNMLILTTFGREVLVPMLVFTNFGVFTDVIIGGYGDTVLVMGGILYGEKDKKGAVSLLKISVFSGAFMMVVVGALTVAFSKPLAELFLSEKDISFAAQTARALTLAALYLVPDIISCIEKKYIQAVGNGLYTAITNFVYNVLCVCLFAVVLVHFLGSDGLFLAYTGCFLVAAIVNTFYVVFFSFKRFDMHDQKMTVYTIRDLNECIRASEEVCSYCGTNDISAKKGLLIGLFIEEMGKNIITYGFRKKHGNSIVIKIIVSKDKITLNMKDNCVLFDPTYYYDTMRTNPDHSMDGIGIKMLMKLSKNVIYTTGFNLNNLFIEV